MFTNNKKEPNKYGRRSKSWFISALSQLEQQKDQPAIDMDIEMGNEDEEFKFDIEIENEEKPQHSPHTTHNPEHTTHNTTHNTQHTLNDFDFDFDPHKFQQQQQQQQYLTPPQTRAFNSSYNDTQETHGSQLASILTALQTHTQNNSTKPQNININSPQGIMVGPSLIGTIQMPSPISHRKQEEKVQSHNQINRDAYRELICTISGKKWKFNNGNSPAIHHRATAHVIRCNHTSEWKNHFPVIYKPDGKRNGHKIKLVICKISGKWSCPPLAIMYKKYLNYKIKNKLIQKK
eukprot:830246_1